MRSTTIRAATVVAALLVTTQSGAQAPTVSQTGPGVQAPRDSKYQAYLARHCKSPPPPPAAPPPRHPVAERRAYEVQAIAGVIDAGATWTTVWSGTGNNADGPVATADGGVLFAQNSVSKVMKLDGKGDVSHPYAGTNTGGSLAKSSTGELYVLQRGLPQQISQLEPRRRKRVSTYQGEPLDCTGGLLNDMTAASNGDIYFTMGSVFHADAKGRVTRYGSLTGTNGIVLSRDEKTLYVTGRRAATSPAPRLPGLVAYDIQADGSLTNERQFALVGEDGSAIDSQGRIYATGGGGVQVIDVDGKVLGEIPSPRPLITVVFAGADRKTLYGVANDQQVVEIFTIPLLAQGYEGRSK